MIDSKRDNRHTAFPLRIHFSAGPSHADADVLHPSSLLAQVAFGTAFVLNAVTVLFERKGSKRKLAIVACYINILAVRPGRLAPCS